MEPRRPATCRPTRAFWVIFAAIAALAAGLAPRPLAAAANPPHGISAPAGVTRVPLETLIPLGPVQLSHRIDGLDFWAIPLEPSTDYYQSLDLTSPAAWVCQDPRERGVSSLETAPCLVR